MQKDLPDDTIFWQVFPKKQPIIFKTLANREGAKNAKENQKIA